MYNEKILSGSWFLVIFEQCNLSESEIFLRSTIEKGFHNYCFFFYNLNVSILNEHIKMSFSKDQLLSFSFKLVFKYVWNERELLLLLLLLMQSSTIVAFVIASLGWPGPAPVRSNSFDVMPGAHPGQPPVPCLWMGHLGAGPRYVMSLRERWVVVRLALVRG